MHLTVSSGTIVLQNIWIFFQIIFLELSSVEIFKLFQNPAIFSFIIFKRTQGTSIPANYIYFTKKTN